MDNEKIRLYSEWPNQIPKIRTKKRVREYAGSPHKRMLNTSSTRNMLDSADKEPTQLMSEVADAVKTAGQTITIENDDGRNKLEKEVDKILLQQRA